ncbi:superoxide dismutase [Candidatus Parcubacteria bacterium]|nr:MAG: superoxide dismutase [Candidatus Parcubacteria bacterium]
MGNDPKLNIKPLPFSQNLQGISEDTIKIHHDKLYAGYVNKANEIEAKLAKIASGQTPAAGNQTYSALRALRVEETFANNGVYLHEYYFNCLGGDGEPIDNSLTAAIKEKWGSIDNFVNYFTESAMAVRGWVVFAWDTQQKRLKIYGADAHNQGGVWGCLPIIVLDVYEHAYFADYGSDRKSYIADFWKNFNWRAANELFEQIKK